MFVVALMEKRRVNSLWGLAVRGKMYGALPLLRHLRELDEQKGVGGGMF